MLNLSRFFLIVLYNFWGCTVGVLGIYAVLWQQIIKRMDVSQAYMFKGTGVVFGLLLAHFVFGEAIATTNMVGAAIIICGLTVKPPSNPVFL